MELLNYIKHLCQDREQAKELASMILLRVFYQ